MPLKILIVPDKFKGTLTASDAAQAIARGWRRARARDTLELLPMSDGGDGFGAVMSGLLGARAQVIQTVDAAHRRCRVSWWWEPGSKTAIVDSANVIGLAMLPSKKFHPFALDTFGLGTVLKAAAARGAKRCWVGIGGSATNDGGFGMARALGWKFLDHAGKSITTWTGLGALATLQPSWKSRLFEELIVAVDVQNPLLGARGCSRIYGPQKGLRPADFSGAEKNLRQLAGVAKQFAASKNARRKSNRDIAAQPGAGAAGGLGFGLKFFLDAEWRPGFDLFAQAAQLKRRWRTADLVITGEGAIDASTLMGKGVGEIARQCRQRKIPCIGLAGVVLADRKAWQKYFMSCRALVELTSGATAKKNAASWLEKLAAEVARTWLEE